MDCEDLKINKSATYEYYMPMPTPMPMLAEVTILFIVIPYSKYPIKHKF